MPDINIPGGSDAAMPAADVTPRVSVVIPTRSRTSGVLRAATSVLACDYSNLELIVVDQSSDTATETALQSLLADPRIRHLKTNTAGVSAARNHGIEHARGEIIGLTDDDCEVSSTWVQCLAESLGSKPTTGLVFGVVIPGEHDKSAGFVPGFLCQEPAQARAASQSHRVGGMGACMATRKSVWSQLQGFDERLGAGSSLGAGEDTDFSVRTLLSGHLVEVNPDLQVVHHGFRTWEAGRVLIHRYWKSTGAVLAMNAKIAPWSICRTLVGMSRGWLLDRSPIAKTLGDGRSHKWLRLTSFAQGFLMGLSLPTRPNPRQGD